MKRWVWLGLLAIAGIVAGMYVGQELLGGEALGWAVSGAIIAPCCAPLFRALFARNAEVAARRKAALESRRGR